MRMPKRGFNVPNVKSYNAVRLDRVQDYIDSGKLDHKNVIDAEALIKAGVIRRALDGVRLVKGVKDFTSKKVTFNVHHASAGVVAAIEALGGKIDMPKAEETKADA
jgi:large subunit ribosomal protein L15